MRYTILFFLVSTLFFTTSCEQDEDCRSCRQVITYDDGTVEENSSDTYCGDELADVESEEPVTVGDATNSWVCE